MKFNLLPAVAAGLALCLSPVAVQAQTGNPRLDELIADFSSNLTDQQLSDLADFLDAVDLGPCDSTDPDPGPDNPSPDNPGPDPDPDNPTPDPDMPMPDPDTPDPDSPGPDAPDPGAPGPDMPVSSGEILGTDDVAPTNPDDAAGLMTMDIDGQTVIAIGQPDRETSGFIAINPDMVMDQQLTVTFENPSDTFGSVGVDLFIVNDDPAPDAPFLIEIEEAFVPVPPTAGVQTDSDRIPVPPAGEAPGFYYLWFHMLPTDTPMLIRGVTLSDAPAVDPSVPNAPITGNPTSNDPTPDDPAITDPTTASPPITNPTTGSPTIANPTTNDPAITNPTISPTTVDQILNNPLTSGLDLTGAPQLSDLPDLAGF